VKEEIKEGPEQPRKVENKKEDNNNNNYDMGKIAMWAGTAVVAAAVITFVFFKRHH
jgi:uncharacterized membrane protein YvbJ